MGQMPAADGETIAIAAGHEHQQFRVGQFDALGDGQRTSVDAVEPVGRGVAGDAAGAADARDESDLMGRTANAGQGPGDGGQHAKVTAARAPDRLQIAFVIARGKGLDGDRRKIAHGSQGCKGWPVQGYSSAGSACCWRVPCMEVTISRRRSTTSLGLMGLEPLLTSALTPAGSGTYICTNRNNWPWCDCSMNRPRCTEAKKSR